MATKTHLLIFLSTAIMATSIADAQILNVGLNISGIVNCTLNSTVGGAAPPFPNAMVQLQCPTGNSIANATTNSNGQFSISVNVLTALQSLTSSQTCRIVVLTPLANCNASLPLAGRLVSDILEFVGFSISGTNITVLLSLLGLNFNAGIITG